MKRSKRIFFTVAFAAIGVQLIALGLYQYGETYGFDATFNPVILLLWIMVLLGVAGIIGKYLTRLDIKKGHCNLGITEEQIRYYREKHNFPDPYIKMREKNNEDDHDTNRQRT